MKKFLSILLALAVGFTFTFGSAMSAFAYTADDTTALITTAQDTLKTAEDNLDNVVKPYFIKNVGDITVKLVSDDDVTVKKAALEKITDDVFAALKAEVVKVYQEQIKTINSDTTTAALTAEQLKTAKTTVANAITEAYATVATIDGIVAYIQSNFAKEAAEAQFDVAKAAALAELDKVNYDNYSDVKPDAPTYEGKYYSNREIAKAVVTDAADEIKDKKFAADADTVTLIATGFTDAVADVVDIENNVYYVKYNSNRITTIAQEEKTNKTLAEEKAYQITVVNGKAALAEAAARKLINTALEAPTLTAADKKVYNDALSNLSNYFAAAKEVAAAQINYAEDTAAAKAAASYWIDECDKIIAATTITVDDLTGTNGYVPAFEAIVAITEDVNALKALAAKMKAETGFNGTPLYDAADIDKALEKDIKATYTVTGSATNLTNLQANEDLVKAEMDRVITDASITLDKVVYVGINSWDLTVFEGTRADEAAKVKAETLAAVRAAKTVADVDAAFIAGCAKLDAIAKVADKNKFQATATDAKTKYGAKLDAEYATKVADYGEANFGKDYDVDKAEFLQALKETLDKAYNAEELEKLYSDAVNEIKNLKTKAELQAEQKAINDAILAIKAPVTAADEATIVELNKRTADFNEYLETIGADGTYTLYDSLLGQYSDKVKDLAEEAIENAITAIGTVTVEDEAAIAELRNKIDAYKDNYNVDANEYEEKYTDLYGDLMEAKAVAVEDMINKIDASADPVDADAIKAAREAYDALGEYTISSVAYHKLLSLENLAAQVKFDDKAAKAYVQDLAIAARTVKSGKKVKVTINADVQTLIDNGFTVEYKFYKSTKKSSGYKNTVNKTTNTYTNTNPVKGKNYYKVKLVVKNADGTVVATTPLTQCKYGVRTIK